MPQSQKSNFSIIALLFLLTLTGCTKSGQTSTDISNDDQSSEVATQNLAIVRGKVLTDSGEMVTAGIVVENEAGDTYRVSTNLHSGYNLRLAPGTYKLHFMRGFEFSTVTKTITVEAFKTYIIQDVRLVQLEDSYAKGWIRGDLHQHTFYSDGLNSVNDVFVSNVSNDLYYGFLTDHNTAFGLPEWVQGSRMVANIDSLGNKRMFNAYEGVEVTTEFGHYQALGLGLLFDLYEVTLRDIERNKPQAEKDQLIKDRIKYIGETIQWAGGVAQINHPYSTSTMGFKYWDMINYFNTVEIWNGYFFPGDGKLEPDKEGYQGQNYRTKMHWFDTLNEIKNGGHFIAATAGTDNHDISGAYKATPGFDENNLQSIDDYNELFQKYGKYSGAPSTVVKIDGEITQTKVLEAIKKGHSFMTNGPMLYTTIDGKTYGETITLSGTSVTANIELFTRYGFEELRVVVNGEVVDKVLSEESRLTQNIVIDNLKAGDWIVFEVSGKGVEYAITNPFFIA